jgi:hypothetical protein
VNKYLGIPTALVQSASIVADARQYVVTERAHNRTRFYQGINPHNGWGDWRADDDKAQRFTKAEAEAFAKQCQDNPNNQNPVLAKYDFVRLPK